MLLFLVFILLGLEILLSLWVMTLVLLRVLRLMVFYLLLVLFYLMLVLLLLWILFRLVLLLHFHGVAGSSFARFYLLIYLL